MRIHPSALERLKAAPFKSDSVAHTFEEMLSVAKKFKSPGVQITMDYQSNDDRPVEGDLIPVIVLSFRPATLPETLREDE